MGRIGGRAAGFRGRTTAYGALLAAAACLGVAAPAGAQSAGGAQPEAGAPEAAPPLSAPPPGVKVRRAPVVRNWRCISECPASGAVSTGSVLRLRGRRLRRTYEVSFFGGEGVADDVSAAPLRRKRTAVDVRVPLGAVAGPVVVADRNGLGSVPGAALALEPRPSTAVAGSTPAVEVQAQARRAFFDAERPAEVSYVVHGSAPARVQVDLLRSRDGAVVTSWDAGEVAPDTPQSLSWDGTVDGRLQRTGRYSFRVSAVSPSGASAVSSQAVEPPGAPDPSEFVFLQHAFPVRGPHGYGEHAASFGGGRGHQGHDVFAACGTPIVAARGGVVEFEQYHGRAGHYIVIDGQQTGVDYAYMHMREAALVDEGDRVRTGELIGYVGDTGRAFGCHLHFEMWSAPGWYSGGSAFDPHPSLLAWDKRS